MPTTALLVIFAIAIIGALSCPLTSFRNRPDRRKAAPVLYPPIQPQVDWGVTAIIDTETIRIIFNQDMVLQDSVTPTFMVCNPIASESTWIQSSGIARVAEGIYEVTLPGADCTTPSIVAVVPGQVNLSLATGGYPSSQPFPMNF